MFNILCNFVAYSLDGLLIFGLLLVCSCAYVRQVPKLKQWFLSEKKGFFGILYKGKNDTIDYESEIFEILKLEDTCWPFWGIMNIYDFLFFNNLTLI